MSTTIQALQDNDAKLLDNLIHRYSLCGVLMGIAHWVETYRGDPILPPGPRVQHACHILHADLLQVAAVATAIDNDIDGDMG